MRDAVGDADAGAEEDVGLDRDVAAELGVEGEPHRLGRDQAGAFGHRLGAAAAPARRLRRAANSARLLGPIASAASPSMTHGSAAVGGGDHDDVGEVIFASGHCRCRPVRAAATDPPSGPRTGSSCTGRRRAPRRSRPYARPSWRSRRRRRRGSGHRRRRRAGGSRARRRPATGSACSASSIARIVAVRMKGTSP